MSVPWRRFLRPGVAALVRTWRWEVRGEEHLVAVRAAGERVIFAPWHATLIPLVWLHRHQGITLLVSAHGDGGVLADVAARWGYRIVRGSSTRGGATAYRLLVRSLETGGDAGVTPDGPRGPAGHAKPGVVAAARRARATIVPVAAHATRAWRLHSWDRMLVPQPFATVRVVYGAPLRVAPRTPLEVARADLERRLRSAQDEAAA